MCLLNEPKTLSEFRDNQHADLVYRHEGEEVLRRTEKDPARYRQLLFEKYLQEKGRDFKKVL